MAKTLGLLLKIFLPLVAAAGIGGGSWYIYEETNPTILKAFSKKGYSWSPVVFTGKETGKKYGISDHTEKIFNFFQEKECTKSFFPGLQKLQQGFNLLGAASTNENINVEDIKDSPKDKVSACLVLEIGHNPDTSVSEGLANWELALKKGDKGLLLMGYGFDSIFHAPNTSSHEFRWIVFYLTKQADKWKAHSGVMFDEYGASTSYSGQKLIVKSENKKLYEWSSSTEYCKPENKTDVHQLASKHCVGPQNWKYFGLSAFWEETDSNGEEVFEIIDQKFNNTQGDIWGRKNFDFDGDSSSSNIKGWQSSHGIFIEGNWKNTGNNTDQKTYLQKIYKPFKGKKGVWKNTDEFCNQNKNIRNANNKDLLEKVQNFCLTKK